MPALTVDGLSLDHVRGVSFDAADTLFHGSPVWNAVGPELERRGVTGTDWQAAVEATGGAGRWPEDSASAAERSRRWTDFYTECLARTVAGPDDGVAGAAAAAVTDPRCYRVFPDVRSCLARLAEAGVPLVVTSNFDTLLLDILDHLDLRRWFAAVVYSYDTGAYKPSPVIFHAAARALGLVPDTVAHVGDSPMSDAGGARAVGMTPIVVDRRSRTVPNALTLCSLDPLGWG